ncbi:histidine kinase, partial [Rhizobium johnstonii]|uniref:histidine kinase n=1 Tax=Rhizobium johnstonii TaxID=3019933 RepID=UPI003F956CD7
PHVVWLWPTVALELVVIPTLLLRRTHPGLMLVVAIGATTVLDAVRLFSGVPPTNLYTLAFVLILLYAVVRWGSGRELLLAGALVLIGLLRSLVFDTQGAADLIGGIAVLAICATIGIVFRSRSTVREARLEQMRLQERERLARDLHDTVAHHVSAIAVRAQAG